MSARVGDPAVQGRAASRAGRLVAQGLLDGAAEAPALLAAICAAASRAAPGVDRGGMAMRLHHRFADARDATNLQRNIAAARIAADLAPLLDRRAPGATLIAAAHHADPGAVLSAAERLGLVEDAILRRLRGARR